MKNLHDPSIERYRWKHPNYPSGNAGNGWFRVQIAQAELFVMASNGGDWDHVSVSLPDRCPTWDEMDAIARLFFEDDETCMQLHVPPADHVSFHPFCLHLWRPRRGVKIPRPPKEMIA